MRRRERLQVTPANSRLKSPISLFPSPLTLHFGCPRVPGPAVSGPCSLRLAQINASHKLACLPLQKTESWVNRGSLSSQGSPAFIHSDLGTLLGFFPYPLLAHLVIHFTKAVLSRVGFLLPFSLTSLTSG